MSHVWTYLYRIDNKSNQNKLFSAWNRDLVQSWSYASLEKGQITKLTVSQKPNEIHNKR
jgi:hypothetical protein